jgi:hypothetical protein
MNNPTVVAPTFVCGRASADVFTKFSEKRISNFQALNSLAVLKIFSVQSLTFPFDGTCDDQGIVPMQSEAFEKPEGSKVEARRGLDSPKPAEYREQEPFGLIGPQRLREAAIRHVEKLLHNLIANDPFARIKGSIHQVAGNERLGWHRLVE